MWLSIWTTNYWHIWQFSVLLNCCNKNNKWKDKCIFGVLEGISNFSTWRKILWLIYVKTLHKCVSFFTVYLKNNIYAALFTFIILWGGGHRHCNPVCVCHYSNLLGQNSSNTNNQFEAVGIVHLDRAAPGYRSRWGHCWGQAGVREHLLSLRADQQKPQ